MRKPKLTLEEKQERNRQRSAVNYAKKKAEGSYDTSKKRVYDQQYRLRENARKMRQFSSVRERAEKKGIAFSLTFEDISWPSTCPVLGIDLDYGPKGVPKFNSPSFDRIDPSKGYTPENTQIISLRANQIKSDATPEELLKVAQYYAVFG